MLEKDMFHHERDSIGILYKLDKDSYSMRQR